MHVVWQDVSYLTTIMIRALHCFKDKKLYQFDGTMYRLSRKDGC
jgi:hypothetical protein